MPLADFVKPPAEFGHRTSRLGDGAKIEKKGGGLVITGSVAALDLGLHLLPGTLAASGKGLDPGKACFLGFLRLPTAVSRSLLGLRVIASKTDRACAGPQFAGGSRSTGRAGIVHPKPLSNEGAQFRRDMGITIEQACEQVRLEF